MDAARLFGQGISFPPRVGADGRFTWSVGEDNIREAIYDKLQRVGFAFHDVLSTGQLINRALTDLQNVRSFIQTAVLTSLEIGLIVMGYEFVLISVMLFSRRVM